MRLNLQIILRISEMKNLFIKRHYERMSLSHKMGEDICNINNLHRTSTKIQNIERTSMPVTSVRQDGRPARSVWAEMSPVSSASLCLLEASQYGPRARRGYLDHLLMTGVPQSLWIYFIIFLFFIF